MLPLILLSLLTLASSKASAVQITGEYWISPSTNGQHLSTLQDPFDGSTTANFDSTIQSLPAGSTIHVLPGTYDTLGNLAWTLKNGQKLLGSGMGVTILRAAQGTNHQGLIVVSSSQYVANTNIEVSDLTVDCNYPTNLQSSTYGCIIGGTHCAIRRVQVINGAGPSAEAFGLGIEGWTGSNCPSEGNIIEECEFSQFKGGTCSAIAMSGCSSVANSMSGIIRNNRIYMNLANTGVAINAADARNLLVEGNFTFSAPTGFYGDTDSYEDIVVSHNSFINCYYGVYLANSGRRNISLLFNNISMTNDASAASVAFAFGTANYTNVVIRGNTAKFHAAPGPNGYSVYVGANSGMNGLTIAQNFFDGSFMWNLSDATNVNIHDNYDLRGVLLTNVNQTQPANGLTRRTVNANDSLNYADRYLGVLVSSAALTITLPSASGRAGKEFIVADESGNATSVKSITIAPTSPDKVNGSTAGVAITSAYGTKTIISDGANWFAR